MENEHYGIEVTKEFIKAGADLAEDLYDKGKDGLTAMEALSVGLSQVGDIYRLSKKIPDLKKEWKDRDAAEKEELVQFTVNELGFLPEHAEEVTVEFIKLGNQVDSTIVVLKEAIDARREVGDE